MAPYRPAPRILELGADFYDPVTAADLPLGAVRFRHDAAAASIGLGALDHDAWVEHFGRFRPLTGNLETPLALRYHGHQFRVYNPALGDGRGFLFAQLLDEGGRLVDLGTKGSGTTPYSRGGDGRLTLKGGVREVLATEMLEALGVRTSRSLSLIETEERLVRNDEPSPTRAAVLVRLSHSHVRFGSFQRPAYHGRDDQLQALLHYTARYLMPELCCPDGELAAMVLRRVVASSARLWAAWMVAGFVHGVLNTDNMSITGESFDYGPYRFTPTFDPSFVAAYFDHGGLYAFGRQAEAVRWNLARLAESLEPIAGRQSLAPLVGQWEPMRERELDRAFLWRLGVAAKGGFADRRVRLAGLELLERSRLPIDAFFADWLGGPEAEGRALRGPRADVYRSVLGRGFRQAMAGHPPRADFADEGEPPVTLSIGEVEAVWDAIARHDDWSAFERKISDIRRLGRRLRSPP